MLLLDKIFCGFFVLATCGHLFGTIKMTVFGSSLFVWSLSGVLAGLLLIAFNLLRISRRSDKTIAVLALAGNLGWVSIVLLFGHAVGNLFDPRVVMHGVTAFVLALFSLRSLKAG